MGLNKNPGTDAKGTGVYSLCSLDLTLWEHLKKMLDKFTGFQSENQNTENNRVEKFNFNGQEISVLIDENNNPLFIAKEVCDLLGYSNNRETISKLDDDEKLTSEILTSGQKRVFTLITESGLYSLVLRSTKPVAKSFKKWVTSEVLPSIRKHGIYATPKTLRDFLRNPDSVIEILSVLQEEREKNVVLENQVKELEPKRIFADAVAASSTTILVGELAKLLNQNGIEIGQNRLFRWLRDNGYLIARNGSDYNMPTQKAMELGLFKIKETSITHSDGHISISKTTKVTGKGQGYFINKFLAA